jgi:hypothetical protein
MRWLSPMPVRPAIVAGTQPPLGVTDTSQPFASAAITVVVPLLKPASKSASCWAVSSAFSSASSAVLRCCN